MAKDDKLKALDAAIAQIEICDEAGGQFRKYERRNGSYRVTQSGYCIGTRRTSERTYH